MNPYANGSGPQNHNLNHNAQYGTPNPNPYAYPQSVPPMPMPMGTGVGVGGGAGGGLPEMLASIPDDQKAMIMRVISMTPEEIGQLPLQERASIVQLVRPFFPGFL